MCDDCKACEYARVIMGRWVRKDEVASSDTQIKYARFRKLQGFRKQHTLDAIAEEELITLGEE